MIDSGIPLGSSADTTFFGALEPEEVLYEFDSLRIFTSRSPRGDLFLAYSCDEDHGCESFLVVPFSEAGVADLKSGRCTLRDALAQPWSWIVQLAADGHLTRANKVDVDRMPPTRLPLAGAYLLPGLQPLFSVKLLGDELKPGNIPASVVRLGVDQAYRALKALVDRALRVASSSGRPEDRLRRHYDLPTQRLAFGSLEISFGEPKAPNQYDIAALSDSGQAADRLVYGEVESLIARGSRWLESGDDSVNFGDRDDMLAILNAFSALAPPSKGLVERIEIGGRLVRHGRGIISLSRSHAQRIKRARQRIPALEEYVVNVGFIREMDVDKQSFILRSQLDGGIDLLRGWVSDELLDDARAALILENRVRVTGVRVGAEQVEIQRIDPVDNEFSSRRS